MKKLLLFLGVIIVAVLAWAPWLTKDEAREIVQTYSNFQYQHNIQKGTENPEIHVFKTPFCRWVTTYEGGWFVCFWQGLKNNSGYNDALVQSIQDSSCKKYYDGCNTCEKMGMEEVCAEKYCAKFGEPKCLDDAQGVNKTYTSAQYSLEYPDSYTVEESKELPRVLIVRGSKGRVEIFKSSDFKDPLTKKEGVRSHGYSSSGFDEYEAKLVPKEKLAVGEYGVWLFYRKDDNQTMEEVRGIFGSIQVN